MNKKDKVLRKQHTNLTLGPKLKAMAEEYCKENEKSLSALVSDLLREFLDQYYSKKKK